MSPVSWDILLGKVQKPSRYLGIEINSVHKKAGEVRLRAALVFPDLYEVGMSHLGTQILYSIGNLLEGVQVERVFLPEGDMLDLLRSEGLDLATLESRTPLAKCHLLGVTLQSELTYTNILTVLDAAGIPHKAGERNEDHPIIIGGGPCVFNPEPLADFFDLFYLGDGERQWPAMLRTALESRDRGWSRTVTMSAIRELDGVYDPADYLPEYNEDGTIRAIAGPEGAGLVLASTVEDLDEILPISAFMVPFLPPIHDRVNIEATRGCTRGCRFCHAGMVTRPVRERTVASVLETADVALTATGYEDLALTSLSIGDFGPLDEVLGSLMDRYGQERVSISLPSMRIGGLTPEVARQILRVRRTGFTLAPEAGTDRLRRVLNKGFSDDEILRTAGWVFENGWEAVKLYFMIGLPTETDEDLDGIVGLVNSIAENAPGNARITANISPFVPKAHTPFQWASQEPEPELKRRLDYLKGRLRGRKIQVRWSRTDQALLEAALARGDRRMSSVIEAAWRSGAVRDGWEEHFKWERWRSAFVKVGLDPAWYASRQRDESEVMPWDHLSAGVTKDFLLAEYRKGIRGEVTPDCRDEGCQGCGACTTEQMANLPPIRLATGPDGPGEEVPEASDPMREADRPIRRVRTVFERTGDIRFLGHLEMVRLFERACRRASIPLAFTGGYSPKPRINFALSLPTATEALAEWLDLELNLAMPSDELMEKVNLQLPDGVRILAAWKTSLDGAALNGRVRSMEYTAGLPEPADGLEKLVSRFMEQDIIEVVRVRKGKEKTVDLKEFILSMEATDDRSLKFSLALKGEAGSARPAEVLGALLGLEEDEMHGVRLTRTRLSFALTETGSGDRPGWSRIWD
ncbi:MAG: TIGR03960 family B12-binding radical SAM protein [bacterium]|nr:TIGR03960 family B12-binding radical SAM protein [bacterium]